MIMSSVIPDFTSLITPSLSMGACANSTQVMESRIRLFNRLGSMGSPSCVI